MPYQGIPHALWLSLAILTLEVGSVQTSWAQSRDDATESGNLYEPLKVPEAVGAAQQAAPGLDEVAPVAPKTTDYEQKFADTLVRSISADAHNTGAALRYSANGMEFARVIERDTACPICSGMKDKIIWLGDPRLRPPYHPRCRGGLHLSSEMWRIQSALRTTSEFRR